MFVDFTSGVVDPASRIGVDLDGEVAATARLLRVVRATGVPILFTTILSEGGETTAWLRKAPGSGGLRRGTTLVEPDSRLDGSADEPLPEKRAARAVASGRAWCTRRSTATRPWWSPTALGDRAAEPHRAGLDIQAEYGDVVELGDALTYLHGAA
nr:isochorismatase family protein [Actinopolyspora biskrensis]